MPSYIEARAAIAEIIREVRITEPDAIEIAHVYETRPDDGAIKLAPSVTITGYSMRYQRFPGSTRERRYTIGLRLFVRPASASQATMQGILDALKDAISEEFDTKVTLGLSGGYSVVEGPNWNSEEPLYEGGGLLEDGEIIVLISDTATFDGGTIG